MTLAMAWLEWNGTVYWSQYSRSAFEPRSAVTSLIEGIWQLLPGSAHFILRSRIFMNYEPTEMCRGMIVVCGKRMARLPAPPDEILRRMRLKIDAIEVDALTVSRTSRSRGHSSSSAFSLPELDRSIECWLLSREGRLLACAINTSGRNRTQHAEMNLLQLWWMREKRPLPAGSRLITTLEPCPMCAGAIWECIERTNDFRVQYVSPDPGTVVNKSVLKRSALLEQCKNLDQGVFFQDSNFKEF